MDRIFSYTIEFCQRTNILHFNNYFEYFMLSTLTQNKSKEKKSRLRYQKAKGARF